jgi:hypothetical protein
MTRVSTLEGARNSCGGGGGHKGGGGRGSNPGVLNLRCVSSELVEGLETFLGAIGTWEVWVTAPKDCTFPELDDKENIVRSLRGILEDSIDSTCSKGSSIVKTVPFPSSLVTCICPLTPRTYRAMIARSALASLFTTVEVDLESSAVNSQSSSS